MGLFSKFKEGLRKTKKNIVGQIDSMLKSFTKIDEDLFLELEELLILGDVGMKTAQKICKNLKVEVKNQGITDPEKIPKNQDIIRVITGRSALRHAWE